MAYQYKVHNKNASLGSPFGELVVEVDMGTIGATEAINITDAFTAGAQVVSCQLVSKGLTGTLNGTADLQQSNDGGNFDLLGIQANLSAANESNTLQKDGFSGKYLGVLITKAGITGGTLELHFVVKHK